MPDRSLTSPPACRLGAGGRLVRGAVAVMLGAVAASMLLADPVIGAVAGVSALPVAVMAITGRCPADWFASRRQSRAPQGPNTLGFPEAHEHVDLVAADTTFTNRGTDVQE